MSPSADMYSYLYFGEIIAPSLYSSKKGLCGSGVDLGLLA